MSERLALGERAHAPALIAGAGLLHLDHLGPEIGEQAGTERAGDHRRGVNDPHAAKRPGMLPGGLGAGGVRNSDLCAAEI